MIFSKSFPNVDINVIGLYDAGCVISLFGFGMTVMIDFLNAGGK